MDNKKIFLVNLSKGRLGDINANLLGMIFVMKFQQAAMSRQDIPEDQRQDFCLYVDEFQNFATDSFESILSEARKYRLNLIVANQFMTQLTDKIREALLGNVGTIICGRVGVTDADLMVKAFTPAFTAEDLTKTPNHAAICKVMMFGMPSAPFTMKLLPPMGEPNEELMTTLKAYSATKFGKTRAEVEKEIEDRWSAAEKAKKAEEAEKPAPTPPPDTTTTPKTPSEPSEGLVEPRSSQTSNTDHVGDKPASQAQETPKKGFLDDWMAKRPTPPPKKPSTPTTPPVSTPSPAPEPQGQPDEVVFKVR